MSFSIIPPFPVFNDLDGKPLENGFIYIGTSNLNPETAPINVFWDSALTVPAAQPVRTVGGFLSRNGSPANIYMAEETYSITVRNVKKVFVYSDANQSNVPTFSLPGDNVSFIQAGTGAVTRNMQSKARESVSVLDFGAVGDGVADDTAAIQAAVNAAQTANGATVSIPQGTYKISAPISIVSPVSIIGMAGGTVIAPNFATGSVFQIVPPSAWPSNYGVTIANLNFIASVVRTSGAYLSSNNGYYVTVTRCQFINGYNGIHLTGPAATGFYVKDCIVANNTNDNILIDAASGSQGPVDVVLQDLFIHGNGPTGQSNSGVHIKSSGDITLRHVSTVWCGTGLRIQPANGNRIQALICTECFFDSGTGFGVYVNTSAGGTVDLLNIANTWMATNQLGGICLTGSALIKQTDLLNCVIANNNGIGVLLDTAFVKNTSIIGCSISGNTNNGIFIAAGVVNFKIVGCTIGPSGEFPANAQWGVYIASGGSDYYIISNNKITDNTAGQLFDGGVGTNKIVYPNIGVGTAITTNAVPSVDWGIDCAKQGAVLIANGTPYRLGVGSGLVLLHSNTTGDLGMFLTYAGSVTKVSGGATMVSGAAGANQVGLEYNSGKYQISNGYVAAQSIYVSTIKTRLES